jgi:hypothetical protein
VQENEEGEELENCRGWDGLKAFYRIIDLDMM